MKKEMMTLLVVVFAVLFAVVSIQPALAGSKSTAVEKTAPAKEIKAKKAQKININTADEATLSSLKGIGPKLAQNIIDYRSKNGMFKNIAELKNVKGIGEKLYSQLAPMLTVK